MSGKLFHAPFIHAHPGFELTGIVERNRDDSRQFYPGSTLFRSLEDLCADPFIELIVVNTPTHLHYEQGIKVLQSGKHLIVEKPFTVTVEEARELEVIALEKSLFLSVYQNRRYDGDFRAVKEVIQKGLIGELREVEIRYDRFRPVASGKLHKEGDLPGSGILYDLSPHLVDQAILLFGFPKALFADVWKMRDDVAADDYFELLFYYDRLRVRLKASSIARESIYSYVLHGTKGSFLQQRSDVQEQQLLEGKKPSLDTWCPLPGKPDGLLHAEINGVVTRIETTSFPGNYMQYYDEVYSAIRGNGKNPVPADGAVRNMRIIDAAIKSKMTGSVIHFTH